MPFYTGCCIYTPGQAFFWPKSFFFNFLYTWSSHVFSYSSSIGLYTCPSCFLLRRRARVLQTIFLSCFFIFKCRLFWTLTKRGNSLIIFSVYFCTNLYQKWGRGAGRGGGGRCHPSVCSLQIPLYWILFFLLNFKDPAGWFSVWISPPFTFTTPICFLKAQLHISSEPPVETCAPTAPVLEQPLLFLFLFLFCFLY